MPCCRPPIEAGTSLRYVLPEVLVSPLCHRGRQLEHDPADGNPHCQEYCSEGLCNGRANCQPGEPAGTCFIQISLAKKISYSAQDVMARPTQSRRASPMHHCSPIEGHNEPEVHNGPTVPCFRAAVPAAGQCNSGSKQTSSTAERHCSCLCKGAAHAHSHTCTQWHAGRARCHSKD